MAGKADWVGDLGAEWARRAEIMEKMLDPFGAEATRALGPLTGKTVLDLGCGGGTSTFRLARRVGTRGTVLGVDVSPDLIALAAARRAEKGGSQARVGFSLQDAGTADFGGEGVFDALFSQFGAMFFDDQVAAYANLRRALKPGASVAIACWRAPKENSWAMLALNAARDLLPPAKPMPRYAPGPFAWSAPEETFAPALRRAGYRDVRWRAMDRKLSLGDGVKGADAVQRATRFSMKIGPLASRLKGADKETRKKVKAAVRITMERAAKDGRVMVDGACWLVTARA